MILPNEAKDISIPNAMTRYKLTLYRDLLRIMDSVRNRSPYGEEGPAPSLGKDWQG